MHKLLEEYLRLDRVCVGVKDEYCLQNISFSVYSGECLMFLAADGIVCARMTELLTGARPHCSGNIYLHDRSCTVHSMEAVASEEICVIGENIRLIENLTVFENLCLPDNRHMFSVPQRRRNKIQETEAFLRKIDPCFDLNCQAGDLSIFEQQVVLAAKAISNNARILIFDNVTNAYTDGDIDRFCCVIASIKEMNVAVLVMSRRISAIVSAADRIMVLRRNTIAHVFRQGMFDKNMLFYCMTSQRENKLEQSLKSASKAKLELLGFLPLGCSGKPMDLSFGEGHITGLLVQDTNTGEGIAESLFGIRPYSGCIKIDGKPVHISNTNQAIKLGIGLLYSDIADNLLFNLSAMENIMLLAYKFTAGPFGFLHRRRARYMLRHILELFPIPDHVLMAKDIRTLSDMELMQLAIAKWCIISTKVMIVLYPYRQLDEGHRLEFNASLLGLKQRGITVIMLLALSTDVENICDEVIVC